MMVHLARLHYYDFCATLKENTKVCLFLKRVSFPRCSPLPGPERRELSSPVASAENSEASVRTRGSRQGPGGLLPLAGNRGSLPAGRGPLTGGAGGLLARARNSSAVA